MIPDWAAVLIGVVGGMGLGLALAYAGIIWYWHRGWH